MTTQITFSDDVGRIATASNSDGSIRWHAYERPFGAGTSIFIQRELNGVLEPEVRFLNEGERPEIFFDSAGNRWLIFYVLNENSFLITADETDIPVTQPPQVGSTATDQFRPGASDPNGQTFGDRNFNRYPIGLAIGSYNGPPDVELFGVGQSTNPGVQYAVRWRAAESTLANRNLYPAGFRILRQLFTGQITDVTPGGFVAFSGFVNYEVFVDAVPGRYFVAQDNFRGDATTDIERGRVIPPGDSLVSDGQTLNLAMERLEIRTGASFELGSDLGITFIDRSPVTIVEVDPFTVRVGEGLTTDQDRELRFVTFAAAAQTTENDTFEVRVGEGFAVPLEQTGFGGVIIG